ncbi:MAG TPA: hypothetical protein VND94_01030 [Terriglobia bacterium]|nr:hypothetical protein [Terriglobia bacterium]
MAKWSAVKMNWTPVAVADTTNFTDSGYVALQGGSSTQKLTLLEVFLEGMASASSPMQGVLARDSTVGATSLTGVSNSPLDPATAALAAPPVPFSQSTTKPQRSTSYLLPLAFNAFGGILRWIAAPGEEIMTVGNTASNGEISVSSTSNGTPGLICSTLIYEPA